MPTVYDMAGLTHQGGLDGFWAEAAAPDRALFRNFRRALAGTVQVRGTLYDRAGCRAAAEGMAERILAGTVNGAGAYTDPPPRLVKAAAMGVRYG